VNPGLRCTRGSVMQFERNQMGKSQWGMCHNSKNLDPLSTTTVARSEPEFLASFYSKKFTDLERNWVIFVNLHTPFSAMRCKFSFRRFILLSYVTCHLLQASMVIGSVIFSGGCALTYFTIEKVELARSTISHLYP
jgi:hypothetical protein